MQRVDENASVFQLFWNELKETGSALLKTSKQVSTFVKTHQVFIASALSSIVVASSVLEDPSIDDFGSKILAGAGLLQLFIPKYLGQIPSQACEAASYLYFAGAVVKLTIYKPC